MGKIMWDDDKPHFEVKVAGAKVRYRIDLGPPLHLADMCVEGRITPNLVRRLTPGKHLEQARRQLASHPRGRELLERPRKRPRPRHPGYGGHDPAFYADKAAAYVSAVTTGESKPVASIAQMYGVPVETASTWIRKARKLRLLTSAGNKRSGGRLTAKAEQLLRGDEDGVRSRATR